MPTKVTTKGYVASCRRYLMDNEWPTDDEFTSALVTARVYVQSRVPRARLLLTSLERSFAHREAIEISPTITIEHIMPQSLSAAWRADLGPKAIEIHERYLHTIGNLTLSGYNADLGNEAFAVKREMLRRSNFELNKEIATADRWTEEQIVTRAHSLAKRAVKIWTR
jgi:hypothetical protein